MAHPCCLCGGECYCSGSIDDCIVDLTPAKCESCGCEDDRHHDHDQHDDDYVPHGQTFCHQCGEVFDEIDIDQQLCHHCGHDNEADEQDNREIQDSLIIRYRFHLN